MVDNEVFSELDDRRHDGGGGGAGGADDIEADVAKRLDDIERNAAMLRDFAEAKYVPYCEKCIVLPQVGLGT